MGELYILREKTNEENRFNAGSKAREDVDSIAVGMGAKPLECEFSFTDHRASLNRLKKASYHLKTAEAWQMELKKIPQDSTVIIQFPVRAHTVFFSFVLSFLRKRKIRTIAVVHDLDTLRNSVFYGSVQGFRLKYEEIAALKKFDIVIAHNEKMKEALVHDFGVREDRLVPLEIFDYLLPDHYSAEKETATTKQDGIIIAGNLDADKCGYIYHLPAEPRFELYGTNYKGDYAKNVRYNGAFPPDELPARLRGSFGLIWDGNETDSCTGIFGEYLRINNPHKTSLYLACGIPVIIWEHAAIAELVKRSNCGIIVDSIDNIAGRLRNISTEEYLWMKQNAEQIGRKLRKGGFTEKAINKCLEKLKG